MTLDDLVGLIPHELGVELSTLAAAVPADLAIVELGSFKGRSTAYLAMGARSAGGHVFAVDAWDLPGNVTGRFGFADPATREAFEAQLRAVRLWSRVTPIRAFSTDAASSWPPPGAGPRIGLLYVDADHSEASVRADFEAWRPHLAPGAVVAFDDYGTPRNPGVAWVVDELVRAGELVDFELRAERLAVGRRP